MPFYLGVGLDDILHKSGCTIRVLYPLTYLHFNGRFPCKPGLVGSPQFSSPLVLECNIWK